MPQGEGEGKEEEGGGVCPVFISGRTGGFPKNFLPKRFLIKQEDSHLRNSILRGLTEGIEVGHNQHNHALHANSLLSGM